MLGLIFVILGATTPLSDAERLFEEGRLAMKSGNPDVACPKFETSHKLVPALGTLLNWAACLEAQGKTASAFMRFNEAEAWANRTAESARAEFASARATKLKTRLSWVVLRLEPFREGTQAIVAGKTITLLSDVTALPVDPGVVEVTVLVPGMPRFAVTERAPGEDQRLELLIPSTPVVPLVTAEPVKLAPRAALVTTPASPTAGPIAGVVLSGTVVVAAITGIAWSLDVAERLKAQQLSGPLTVTRDEYQLAKTLHPMSWVGLGFGLVGVVASSVAWRSALKPRVSFFVAPEHAELAFAWSLP